MEFERYVLVQLSTPADFAAMPKDETRRLQNAHLAYVADLHADGHLLAHGSAAGDDSHTRSFALMTCDLATAREIWAGNPAIQERRYVAEFDEWIVPKNMVRAGDGTPPRSL